MRQMDVGRLRDAVEALFIRASYRIGEDVEDEVRKALEKEDSPAGKNVLGQLLENYKIAREDGVALCQDTGMAVVFLDIGQDLHFTGGDLTEAVNEGVRRAYEKGYLRKSVVRDPLYDRTNTRDNTPAVIHERIVPGDGVRVLCVPKGFGSENMSAMKMLIPADGEKGVIDFVTETVRRAGPNPCPPVIVGVGIGGTMEQAALCAKRMTARGLNAPNPDPRYGALEARILERINETGVGPGGFGGRTTALGVNICALPTHIAGLPVAVNICCHAARHAEAYLTEEEK